MDELLTFASIIGTPLVESEARAWASKCMLATSVVTVRVDTVKNHPGYWYVAIEYPRDPASSQKIALQIETHEQAARVMSALKAMGMQA